VLRRWGGKLCTRQEVLDSILGQCDVFFTITDLLVPDSVVETGIKAWDL